MNKGMKGMRGGMPPKGSAMGKPKMDKGLLKRTLGLLIKSYRAHPDSRFMYRAFRRRFVHTFDIYAEGVCGGRCTNRGNKRRGGRQRTYERLEGMDNGKFRISLRAMVNSKERDTAPCRHTHRTLCSFDNLHNRPDSAYGKDNAGLS